MLEILRLLPQYLTINILEEGLYEFDLVLVSFDRHIAPYRLLFVSDAHLAASIKNANLKHWMFTRPAIIRERSYIKCFDIHRHTENQVADALQKILRQKIKLV